MASTALKQYGNNKQTNSIIIAKPIVDSLKMCTDYQSVFLALECPLKSLKCKLFCLKYSFITNVLCAWYDTDKPFFKLVTEFMI